jgi:hypothetical protein
VAELLVPGLVEDPFREHYRALVMGSLLRAAEAQSERHRLRGHKLRARRAERVAERLRPVQPPPPSTVIPGPRFAAPVAPAPVAVEAPVVTGPPVVTEAPVVTAATAPSIPHADAEPWFGTTIRRAAAVVWFATLAALVANVIVLGIDSPATIAADLGLVAMTFVWFFACIDDLIEPRR